MMYNTYSLYDFRFMKRIDTIIDGRFLPSHSKKIKNRRRRKK